MTNWTVDVSTLDDCVNFNNASPHYIVMNTNINENDRARCEYARSLTHSMGNIYKHNTGDYILHSTMPLDENSVDRMSTNYKKWLVRMAKCAVDFMREYEYINGMLLNMENEQRRRNNEV